MSDTEQTQAPEHINIKVVDQGGSEVFFKIKSSTKLGKLMDAYAERAGKVKSSVRFMYDGTKVKPELDMNDNDSIEVMIEQVGGSRASRSAY